MDIRKLARDYFTFTRKERNGILVLVILIVLLALVNRFIFIFEKPNGVDKERFEREIALWNNQSINDKVVSEVWFSFNPNNIDSISLFALPLPGTVKRNLWNYRLKGGVFRRAEDVRRIYGMTDSLYSQLESYLIFPEKPALGKHTETKPTAQFFYFDPNTVTDRELQQMGLTAGQIGVLTNYRRRIGTFRSREDFSKVYGIPKAQMDSLLAYIQFEKDYTVEKAHEPAQIIELNTADSLELQILKGIGPVLSRRIVRYRELLGGFYDIAQLKEVYGIDEELYSRISENFAVDASKIRQINLQFADQKALMSHPYISREMASAIVSYRS